MFDIRKGYRQSLGDVNIEGDFVLNTKINVNETIQNKFNYIIREQPMSMYEIEYVDWTFKENEEKYVWGAFNNTANRKLVMDMRYGDVVYFTAQNRVKYIGIVDNTIFKENDYFKNKNKIVKKNNSRKILSDIYFSHHTGVSSEAESWEIIYFLNKVKKVDIPLYELNRALGYNDNTPSRGFQVIKSNEDAQKTLFSFLLSLMKEDVVND